MLRLKLQQKKRQNSIATKSKENKTITLPVVEEKHADFIKDGKIAHQILCKYMENHPELFPDELSEVGYSLYGYALLHY